MQVSTLAFNVPTGQGVLLRIVTPGRVVKSWCLITPILVTPDGMAFRVSKPAGLYLVAAETAIDVPTTFGTVAVYFTRSHGKSAQMAISCDAAIEIIRPGYNGPKLIGKR